MTEPSEFPLTVFYDASCPMCSSEMHLLKARDPQGLLVLSDCSRVTFDDPAAARDGITQAMMLSRIHARTASGRWLSGLDVFEAVYRAAGFATLARLFGSRTLRPLFDRIYPWIAANRPRLSRLGLHRVFGAGAPAGASDPQRLRDCNTCRAQSLSRR